MKINKKNEKYFCDLMEQRGVEPDEFISKLVQSLTDKGIIYDDWSTYGETFGNAVAEADITDVIEAVESAGIKDIDARLFFALADVVLMNDYDCPICGCELVEHSHDGEYIGGDGYETPYEHEDIIDSYECPNCGWKN